MISGIDDVEGVTDGEKTCMAVHALSFNDLSKVAQRSYELKHFLHIFPPSETSFSLLSTGTPKML